MATNVMRNGMSQPEGLGSTTSLPSSTTVKPEYGFAWDKLLWIPYVILTLVLMVLACASFTHYHFKNREKYLEAMYKRKNNLHGCARKYRVTLNRKGVVHMTNTKHHPEKPKPTSHVNAMKHDIFIVSNTASKKNGAANGRSVKGWDAAKIRTNQSYDNEAYDQDSSQGSEKSLIRRSSDSPSKMDSCIEMDHEPFTNKGVQNQHREQAYMVSSGKACDSSAPRASSMTSTPLGNRPGADTPTGLAFRSETPLNLPDNSDHTHKKVLLHKGSRSSIGVKHATVAPLREETRDEIAETPEEEEDEFAEEDIDVI